MRLIVSGLSTKKAISSSRLLKAGRPKNCECFFIALTNEHLKPVYL